MGFRPNSLNRGPALDGGQYTGNDTINFGGHPLHETGMVPQFSQPVAPIAEDHYEMDSSHEDTEAGPSTMEVDDSTAPNQGSSLAADESSASPQDDSDYLEESDDDDDDGGDDEYVPGKANNDITEFGDE